MRWVVGTRACLLISVFAIAVLLLGCAQTSSAAPRPTATSMPTATPTTTDTPTPSSAAASTTCQPDPFGIYSDQAGAYETMLNNIPLPAPPRTLHGIGSTGVSGSVSQGGESGVCTVGTFEQINSFYAQQLPALGWNYSAPPAALTPCFHSGVPQKAWWKGSNTFTWYFQSDAGGGSIFWSVSYCTVQS